ncbi:hypothetical protein KKF11_00855 [Patescibacteria group bacterium]|nr:hypothetical protein [Patescibacteria group bacterium]
MKKIKKFLRSFYGRVLLLALFVRFLLMPFIFHPDIKSHHFHFYFLSQGVFNIYEFLASNVQNLPYTDTFNYPPLVYFVFGAVQFLLKPFLGGGFIGWIFDWGPGRLANPEIFRYLFILKIPYLILDIVTAFLLTCFFKEKKQKQKIFLFWLFNPVVLYSIYGLASFDILPSLFVLWSVFLVLKKRPMLGGLILGLAAAFKTYPLLLLPFLAIFGAKDTKTRLKIFILGLVPYFLTCLPFLGSTPFRESVLLSGLSQRLFLAAIPIGFGENLIIFVAALTFLFFLALRFASSLSHPEEKIIPFFLAVLLLVFGLSHFHPQWIVWILPFLTILLVKKPSLFFAQVVFYLSFLAVVFLLNDRAQLFGLLTPINLDFSEMPSIFEILRDKKIIDPFLVQSLFHSLLAGTALWLGWQILKEKNE